MARKKSTETLVKKNTSSTPEKKTIATKPGPRDLHKNTGKPHVYYCTACGTEYDVQEENFAYSPSPYYAGNNNRLSICNHCVNHFMNQYRDLLGTYEAATKRLCLHLDYYYDESMMRAAAKGASPNQKTMGRYVRMLNIGGKSNKTYDDYESEALQMGISNEAAFVEAFEEHMKDTPVNAFEMWGPGYSLEEYKSLDAHYKSLSEQRTTDDPMQEIYIKDLCEIKVQQTRAMDRKSTDDWQKLKKLYQTTAKEANLKTKKSKDIIADSENDTWGQFLANVEQYAPAEYYKDKEKYLDFDGLGEYIERFILRPLRNLFTGSRDIDPEFNVEPDAKGGGE